MEEPQSRAVLAGSTVSFVCNASAVVVANDYPLPTIHWRVNGSETLPGPNWEARMISSTNSELTVRDVELADIGYVECLVKDGISRVARTGKYVNQAIMITSSRRAKLDVVSKFNKLYIHKSYYSNMNLVNLSVQDSATA